jgi:hypothetical protein
MLRTVPAGEGWCMRRIAFHLAGAVLVGLAAAIASYVAFFVAWTATKCGEDPTVASDVWKLRGSLVLLAVGVALVPTAWTFVARYFEHAWRPWAALAALAALVVIGAAGWVRTIDSVGTWCLY